MLMTKMWISFSFMPSRIVDPQFYSYSAYSTQKVPEKQKGNDSIAFFRSHHPMFPLTGLTQPNTFNRFRCWLSSLPSVVFLFCTIHGQAPDVSENPLHKRAVSLFSICAAHIEVFFIVQTCWQHLLPSLEHIGISAAVKKNRVSELIFAHAGHGWLFHVSSEGIQQLPSHPIGFAQCQISSENHSRHDPITLWYGRRIESACPTDVYHIQPTALRHSLYDTILRCLPWTRQTSRLPWLPASRKASKDTRQCGDRSRHQAFLPQALKAFLLKNPCASALMRALCLLKKRFVVLEQYTCCRTFMLSYLCRSL